MMSCMALWNCSGVFAGLPVREHFKEGLTSSAALLFPCWQEAENIIQKIRQQQYPELLAFDQLLIERKDHKVFLQFGKALFQQQVPLPFPAPSSAGSSVGHTERCLPCPVGLLGRLGCKCSCLSILEEEEITFAPTYRFERGTREKYAYTKQKATGVGGIRFPF